MKSLFILALASFNITYAAHFKMTMTNRQEYCVETILHSLSEKSTGALMFNAIQLRSLGKEIDPVPPLEFLYFVYKRDELYTYLKNTQDRYFPWNAFISGFRDKCNKESVYSNILTNLEAFAESTNLSFEELSIFVANRDWRQLVMYILSRR
ncbi:MAG: hypothetical protein S4CHLAM20_12430 [Chlamydiia bacterium]|nr:hypothetical protein [Chlamydiia bacterium]